MNSIIEFVNTQTKTVDIQQEKEELVHSSPPPIERSSPLNPALFEKTSTTTKEEREQIDSFREKVIEDYKVD